MTGFRRYFFSCFLLTVPVLAWDLVFTGRLPEAFQPAVFWNHIPPFISYGENISRTLIFVITALMPLKLSTPVQKKGLLVYIAGLLCYFASWLVLMEWPRHAWNATLAGFMAPAYTPLCWLLGIGLIGDRFYFKARLVRPGFIGLSLTFLLFHNTHTYLIYRRVHGFRAMSQAPAAAVRAKGNAAYRPSGAMASRKMMMPAQAR